VTLTRWSIVLFLLCAFLLATWGGAVAAGPVTLPLLYLAVRRHPTAAFRWVGGVLAGLTTVEVAWVVVYVVDEETKPSIWLVPLATGIVVLGLFVSSRRQARRQARRSSRSPSRNQTSTPSRSRR
jgi:4-hydroxybenzoate polyprenyltransferase